MILADAINTAYVTDFKGIKHVSSILLAFIYALIVFLVVRFILSLNNNIKHGTKEKLILISLVLIFFIPSAVMIFYGYYISWAVPLILFGFIDYLFIFIDIVIKHSKKLRKK